MNIGTNHSQSTTMDVVELEPMDEFNQALIRNVHPGEWTNPTPDGRYNLVVIGAGTAGLVTAAGAAGLGAKVALIERHLMGGDCLNVGCVPSKAIIRSGRVAAEMKHAARYGVAPVKADVDFGAVMRRMREIRASISPHDSANRFKELGVDVFMGEARFTGSDTVDVGGTTLHFKKACIASGARASNPPIEGLAEAGFLTNETVFSLTERPDRLAIIGAGPIGCELAQTFQLLGSHVTLLELSDRIMSREDADASAIVRESMVNDGVEIVTGAKTTRVTRDGAQRTIEVEVSGESRKIVVDEILIGAGRKPNVDGLNLEAANVTYSSQTGVEVNDNLQTTNPNIYAAGDVCMAWKFTHAADFAARIVIQNALFMGRKKLSSLTMPWCTYTHPEVAHVGLYEHEANDRGIAVDTYTQPFDGVDRALTDGASNGFVKVHTKQGTDTILGATLVATNAGDMISEITLAMVNGVGLKGLANTIHPYPTQADAIRKIGDQFNKTRLTPAVKRVMGMWLSASR